MTDLFDNSPNDQKKADELINAGHLDIVVFSVCVKKFKIGG